jgi:glycogen operon protein
MAKAQTAIRPGSPRPFGAAWSGEGVNFAVYSAHAERIDLCLFDEGVGEARDVLALPGRCCWTRWRSTWSARSGPIRRSTTPT